MNHSPAKRSLALLSFAWGLLACSPTGWAGFDHSLYDTLLKTYVQDGLVDYKALKEDSRLDEYLATLAEADLEDLKSNHDKIAFWTNAYNAYTLKLITTYYPVSSIFDIKKPGYADPWKIPLAHVAGTDYTLDQIENEILRPKWPDPRIHYALVCAAMSCPQLRSEAYTADRLDEQFDDQSAWFMIHRNQFDIKKRTAVLSKVYEWYAVDFGKDPTDALRTLIPHVEKDLAEALQKEAHTWKVSYVEWNWELNEQ